MLRIPRNDAMFIDTHAHLVGESDIDAIITRAANANVGAIVCATAHPDDWADALKLADTYSNVFVTIGIHPEYAKQSSEFRVQSSVNHPKIIGIGEIGLDYHYGDENRAVQIELFEKQLEIARGAGLPVAIHSREAEADTMAILDGTVGGVLHSFTGSWDMAHVMLDRGFYFSVNGILTFKNADALRDVFAKIPIDKIVIETDAPYLAPIPYRGKKCEPAMVVETAKALAELKNLTVPELEIILMENTKRLYPKIKPGTVPSLRGIAQHIVRRDDEANQ
jgi:TatD DNase family protein